MGHSQAHQWMHVLTVVLQATLRTLEDAPTRSLTEWAQHVGVTEAKAAAMVVPPGSDAADRLSGRCAPWRSAAVGVCNVMVTSPNRSHLDLAMRSKLARLPHESTVCWGVPLSIPFGRVISPPWGSRPGSPVRLTGPRTGRHARSHHYRDSSSHPQPPVCMKLLEGKAASGVSDR